MFPVIDVEYSKQNSVNRNQSEDLAGYILRLTREGLSYQEISNRAARRGFKITRSYISKLVSGAAQNPSLEKLRALAAGLNRPEEEVLAVAIGDQMLEELLNDALAKTLLFKWSKLSKKDKEDLGVLIRMLNDELDKRMQKDHK